MEFHKVWIEQCEAAEQIEGEFGTQKALDYLVGEKFINFLEAAETDPKFRSEIPAFVAGIKSIFEQWQLAQYLETARETEPFDQPEASGLGPSLRDLSGRATGRRRQEGSIHVLSLQVHGGCTRP